MTDKGFFLRDTDLNGPQIESIHRLIGRAKLGNFVNAQIRIEGKFEYHEADWIKHLKSIPDSDYTAKLEQAIKRIVEARKDLLRAQQNGAGSVVVMNARDAESVAIADAAKMVEDK